VTPRALGARAALAAALLLSTAAKAVDTPASLGESIYRRGVTASGVAVQASRGTNAKLEGAAAACANCHQRSGLGGHEGRSIIPPITGRYLFRPRAKDGSDGDRAIPYVEGIRKDRDPYTDATLARAIRDGVDAQGRPLDYLMPRYALGESEMAELIAHLRQIDKRLVPGVTDDTLHFATIITPDADPVKRGGMLDVMKHFFADRNVRQMVPAPPMRTTGNTAYAKSMFMVHRRWELHVWELSGPESTWQQQLEKRLAAEPVFAVVSGLGGKNWAPVHAFCERSAVPCLFPNVEVPVDKPNDFYSLYLSKGVLLEAELIAKSIVGNAGEKVPKTVRQIYRAGDSGEAAANALTQALKGSGVTITGQALPPGPPAASLSQALRAASTADALVLWLRPDDIAALGDAPAAPEVVYASGTLGGLERAPLPASWRGRTRLAYPFDLPERRRVRVDFALGWFRARHIPLVAEQVQFDTYLACGLVSDTVNHMVDTFVRDYLIERTEFGLEHRITTGLYPRLALSTGQQFASKGGYIVRFDATRKPSWVAEGEWTVP